jgi:hypothetical protein
MSITHTWGIFNRHGGLVHVGLYAKENDAWTIYLGWPDEEEIEANKRQGLHTARVEIIRKSYAALPNGQ